MTLITLPDNTPHTSKLLAAFQDVLPIYKKSSKFLTRNDLKFYTHEKHEEKWKDTWEKISQISAHTRALQRLSKSTFETASKNLVEAMKSHPANKLELKEEMILWLRSHKSAVIPAGHLQTAYRQFQWSTQSQIGLTQAFQALAALEQIDSLFPDQNRTQRYCFLENSSKPGLSSHYAYAKGVNAAHAALKLLACGKTHGMPLSAICYENGHRVPSSGTEFPEGEKNWKDIVLSLNEKIDLSLNAIPLHQTKP